VALRVMIQYHVTLTRERGGECSPYPECAKAPPPEESGQRAGVDFEKSPEGLRIVVPAQLDGIWLKTPLDKKHSTGCHGDIPAFVPRFIKAKG
jgi:hypothetical protein